MVLKNVRMLYASAILLTAFANTCMVNAATAVERHGALRTEGGFLLNKNGNIVQLRGMSFYWSTPSWNGYKYYNEATVNTLVDQWNCTVVRAAYDRNEGNNNGWDGVQTVINAAIKKGIYVIIDWHSHTAEAQASAAIQFFKEQATKYKNTPNVIFEPYNEPINGAGKTKDGTQVAADATWKVIKPYLQDVTQAIRDAGADNLVIAGTPYFCQYVNVAAGDQLKDKSGKPFKNLAYAFHFYAASHGPEAYFVQNDPEKKGGMESSYLSGALGKIPIFVTEWGTTHSDGGQRVDATNSNWWFDRFMNGPYHISTCAWSASDFETSSNFSGSASSPSESGKVVQKLLKAEPTDEYPTESKTGSEGSAKDTVFTMPATQPMARYNRYYGGNFSFTNLTVPFASRDKNDTRTANHTCVPVLGSASGDWISYYVKNTTATKYIVVRHLAKNGTGTLDVQLKGKSVGTVNIKKDTAWVYSVVNADIAAGGTDTIKFVVTASSGDGFLLEWFEFTNTLPNISTLSRIQSNISDRQFSAVTANSSIHLTLPQSHKFLTYQLLTVDGRLFSSGSLVNVNSVSVKDVTKGMWILELSGQSGNRISHPMMVY